MHETVHMRGQLLRRTSQKTGDTVPHNSPVSGNISSDHGFAQRHGLQNGIGKAFPQRSLDVNVQSGEARQRLPPAEPAGAFHLRRQCGVLSRRADPGPPRLVFQHEDQCREEVGISLRFQTAACSHHNRIWM